jgi:hypothetical protein
MPILRGTNFNDGPVRSAVINFFNENFKIQLNETPPEMRVIDLTGSTQTLLGVEVERGGWSGDFWSNEKYSLISGLPFKTINVPLRKEKYWLDEYIFRKKIKINESSKSNIFVRSNKDFTQMIVVRPETIRNPKKLIRTKFKPNNSDEVENWLSFKREHVETYNLVNGTWTLNKNYEI